MKAELVQLIQAERKFKRELLELRALRHKHLQHKEPDKKILAMIDAEILIYTEGK